MPSDRDPSRLEIAPPAAVALDGATLAIARLPFVFTQDALLTTEEFIKEAKTRGHDLDLAILSDLHTLGILKPIFRISDTAVSGRRIEVDHPGELNSRGRFFAAAAAGQLRDVSTEGRSIDNPYERPAGEDHDWWNGFLYSSWQLIVLGQALAELESHRQGWDFPGGRTFSDRAKPTILALCALATRHLPSILGTYSIPGGYDHGELWRSRFDIDDQQRLTLAGFDPHDLKSHAESLLLRARTQDPMIDWLPVLRHASAAAWKRLKGAPLDAHHKRVAAEVLLRAHEELATAGVLEPLPEVPPQGWLTPLHDRLGPRSPAESLDSALGAFGLSPHPRVVVLVEGETEMRHLPRLLALHGLNRPDRVRVHNAGSSNVNPHLLAAYVASPRLGPAFGGHQFLDATPTALVIAMDPENRFATAAQREKELRKLQDAVRQDVQRQGADITDAELDTLVQVFVWSDQTYELANFTDTELADALVQLATEQHVEECGTKEWRMRAEQEFASARSCHQDAKVAIGRMGVPRFKKPRLAELLWPVLLDAASTPAEQGVSRRPVLELVDMIRDTYARLSAPGYALGPRNAP